MLNIYLFCHNKHTAYFCCEKSKLVAINILLSEQKTCFVASNTVFLATKMILVAAPANDREEGERGEVGGGEIGGRGREGRGGGEIGGRGERGEVGGGR